MMKYAQSPASLKSPLLRGPYRRRPGALRRIARALADFAWRLVDVRGR